MARLSNENRERARDIIALYPHRRSALVPLCHLAQEQDGWLTPEAIEDIAELIGTTPADVLGTASFYDMLHTEPVGRYVIAVCTNVACMLQGAYELLEHVESHLGVRPGGSTPDGMFTLEEAECLADCGRAPCLQVNHRFFGNLSAASFDRLVEDLRSGALDGEVPPHGTLCRVARRVGLPSGRGGSAATGEATVEEPAAKESAAKESALRGTAGQGSSGGSRRRGRGGS
jgi:NADH-quinone oxidoreductase subunit E